MIAEAIKDVAAIRIKLVEQNRIEIKFDESVFKMAPEAAAKALSDGEPSILLSGRDNKLTIRARMLQDGEEEIVANALLRLFAR